MGLPSDPIDSIDKILKGIATLMVVGCFTFLVWDDFRLTKQVQQQKSEISDYKSANENLVTQVGRCNASVDQIKIEGEARAKAAQIAVEAARKQRDSHTLAAGAILHASPSGSDCEATTGLLKEYYAGKP